MKILTVYNTCGLSGRDNTDFYIGAIKSIYAQTKQTHLVVSSCLNPLDQIEKLKREFPDLPIHFTPEKLTVNITFNKTVQDSFRKWGRFDNILYIDSGCYLPDSETIDYICTNMTHNTGMITCKTNTDTAFIGSLGFEPYYNVTVPIGKSCNLHCQMFSSDLLDTYGAIIPDIFRSFCTESTFSFLCAGINKIWKILVDKIVNHVHSMDGASSGFRENMNWTDTFVDIMKIINDPEGTACGFGYEECGRIKMHNPFAYNPDGTCKDPPRLARFIKDNIFLPKSILDYDKIQYEWF